MSAETKWKTSSEIEADVNAALRRAHLAPRDPKLPTVAELLGTQGTARRLDLEERQAAVRARGKQIPESKIGDSCRVIVSTDRLENETWHAWVAWIARVPGLTLVTRVPLAEETWQIPVPRREADEFVQAVCEGYDVTVESIGGGNPEDDPDHPDHPSNQPGAASVEALARQEASS